MNPKRKFTIEEAREIGGQLGVNQSVLTSRSSGAS